MGINIDADIVLTGANVLTMNPGSPKAEAVAIRRGRFLWAGSSDEVRSAVGRRTEVRELSGMTVVPGFNEAHNHTLQFGHVLSGILLASARSIDDIVALVNERVRSQKKGAWVFGSGFDQNKLQEKRLPTRWDLDKVCTSHPVALKHTSMHVMAANSQALRLAAVTRDTPDPEGG